MTRNINNLTLDAPFRRGLDSELDSLDLFTLTHHISAEKHGFPWYTHLLSLGVHHILNIELVGNAGTRLFVAVIAVTPGTSFSSS